MTPNLAMKFNRNSDLFLAAIKAELSKTAGYSSQCIKNLLLTLWIPHPRELTYPGD